MPRALRLAVSFAVVLAAGCGDDHPASPPSKATSAAEVASTAKPKAPGLCGSLGKELAATYDDSSIADCSADADCACVPRYRSSCTYFVNLKTRERLASLDTKLRNFGCPADAPDCDAPICDPRGKAACREGKCGAPSAP